MLDNFAFEAISNEELATIEGGASLKFGSFGSNSLGQILNSQMNTNVLGVNLGNVITQHELGIGQIISLNPVAGVSTILNAHLNTATTLLGGIFKRK